MSTGKTMCECGRGFPSPSALTKHQLYSTSCVSSRLRLGPVVVKPRAAKRARVQEPDEEDDRGAAVGDDDPPLVVAAAAAGGHGGAAAGGVGDGHGVGAALALPATQRALHLASNRDARCRWMDAVAAVEAEVEAAGSLRDGETLSALSAARPRPHRHRFVHVRVCRFCL